MNDALRGGWTIVARRGTAATLLAPWPREPEGMGRTVARCTVERPALVLGSTQREDVADAEAARRRGVDVVRRGSGGGAVLLGRDEQVWLDVWLPRHDPLWDDDVVVGGQWVGEWWAAALAALGVDGLSVHRGRAVAGAWGTLLCFAGVGPGEVTVRGAKVVGLSQRRTRQGARQSAMALVRWAPARLTSLLDDAVVPPGEPAGSAAGLRTVVPGSSTLSDGALVTRVADALLSMLG